MPPGRPRSPARSSDPGCPFLSPVGRLRAAVRLGGSVEPLTFAESFRLATGLRPGRHTCDLGHGHAAAAIKKARPQGREADDARQRFTVAPGDRGAILASRRRGHPAVSRNPRHQEERAGHLMANALPESALAALGRSVRAADRANGRHDPGWTSRSSISARLTPHMQRLRLTGPASWIGFGYLPGQDVMLLVAAEGNRPVRRRYTIRQLDVAERLLTLDVVLHGDGPGERWARSARSGDEIEGIGPRGKITTSATADWHLFIGDESALPADMSAMTEALPPRPARPHSCSRSPGRATSRTWMPRRVPASPGCTASARLVVTRRLSPPRQPRSSCQAGRGHAFRSARLRSCLGGWECLDKPGLGQDQVSPKAYWGRSHPRCQPRRACPRRLAEHGSWAAAAASRPSLPGARARSRARRADGDRDHGRGCRRLQMAARRAPRHGRRGGVRARTPGAIWGGDSKVRSS